MRFFTKLVLCGATGLLLFLSFPKADLWFLAWVAYAPLLLVLMREENFKKAAACGFFTHVLFYVLLLYWVPSVPHIGSMGIPGLLLLAIVSSLYPLVFCAGFWFVCKKLLTGKVSFLKLLHCALFSSALFVACDYVRSLGFFGFTWGALGYSQYKNLPVIQIAEFTGYHGVTFLVMFANICVALYKTTKVDRIISLLMLLVFFVWALSVTKILSGGIPIHVAIIQGNTKRDVHWDAAYREYVWDEYEKLSREAMKHNPKPQLLVYPESLIALGDFSEPYYAARFSAIAKKFHVTLATGGFDRDAQGNTYNTAAVFSPDGKLLGKFYKTKLVPFGEYAPFKDIFVKLGYNPWGNWLNLSAGKDFKPVPTRTIFGNIGFNICYETTYAPISRELVKNGANILIGVIADSWFNEAETYQQTAMFVFRAMENQRHILRAADSGISCIIKPNGEILNATKPFTQTIVYGSTFANSAFSFYTRYGDVFVAFCVVYCMLTSVFILMRRKDLESKT